MTNRLISKGLEMAIWGGYSVSKMYYGGNLVYEKYKGIRYIRDSIKGNSINTANHWIEIMAFENDVNVAFKKPVLIDGASGRYKAETITDGNTTNAQSSFFNSGGNIVEIDLGDLYKVDRVQVWHYYGDNRQYYKAKTEVSADGINWITLYDSDVDGTYTETADGKTHYII